ncbi:MAG TPA: hypothetical protein VF692_01200 [Pyrinomonadaceae bacterium]|jgi:hypothetical protein
MDYKTIIAAALILISGGYAFAQQSNYPAIANNRTSIRNVEKKSDYVVSVEEWAKFRFDAPKELESGWRKTDWKTAGISFILPQEFRIVARRHDIQTADWQMRRWQSSLMQPNNVNYEVNITIESLKKRSNKTTVQWLEIEEENLNHSDGSDVSDLPPITPLKINGVNGLISRWEIPQNLMFTWTTYRIYGGKLQKIRFQVSGREEITSGMRKILQSIKIAQD